MSEKVIVVGGGPIGLAAAMLLAAEGREVTVLEKDKQEPPDLVEDAFESWERAGVGQFRQAHFMQPLFRHLLDTNLPMVSEKLVALGGRRVNILPGLLKHLTDRSARPDDGKYETLTGRRPIVERAFAEAAAETAGVTVLRGVGVQVPLAGASLLPGIPHISGVRTTAGATLSAGLVIDAAGRRSKLPEWAAQLGAKPPCEEAADTGFAYYTRHFAAGNGVRWEPRGPLSMDAGTLRVLALPADNDTWTIAVVAVAGDKPFKTLRHNDSWERVARAIPTAGNLVDGRPLSDVLPMAGAMDRHRRIVVDRRPILTGLIPIGDSWACTNPTAGRGISLGLAHAVAFRDALQVHPEDPVKLIELFDETAEATLTPWYRDQVDRDHRRAAQYRAIVEGQPPSPPQPDPFLGLQLAAREDPDAVRGVLDVFSCLDLPQQVLARPGLVDRAIDALKSPPSPAGPTRKELIALANP